MKLLSALLAALMLTGCQGHSERVDSAVQFVAEYVKAASGGDALRGWSMIDSQIKTAMFGNDVDVYVAAVEQADWRGFAWEVDNVRTDDDFVFVRVTVTGGEMPAYLVQPRGNFTLASGDGDTHSFGVRFGALGTRTLFASGG